MAATNPATAPVPDETPEPLAVLRQLRRRLHKARAFEAEARATFAGPPGTERDYAGLTCYRDKATETQAAIVRHLGAHPELTACLSC